jgi:hypothetical protein
MEPDGVDFNGDELLGEDLVDDINTDEVIDDTDLTVEDLLDPSALTDVLQPEMDAAPAPEPAVIAQPTESLGSDLPVGDMSSPVPSSFDSPGPSSPGISLVAPVDDGPLRFVACVVE